jgi:hypothetical protein
MRALVVLIMAYAAATAAAEPESQRADVASEQLFPISVDGREGFIDHQGRVVIEPTYEFLWGFSEGLASVWVDKKAGYINTRGEVVIKPRFRYARNFSEGFAGVETENGWTFIDRAGQPITGETFEAVHNFSDGVAPVQVAGVWGYINRTGAFVIPPQYGLAWPFSNGRAIVYAAHDSRCQVIDTTGAVVLQPEGTDCRGAGPIARRAGAYGTKYRYITATGEPLTPFIFEWAEAFREGMASVRIGNRTGFIDLAGRLAISSQFDADVHNICSRGFSQGLSAVMIEGRCGYIDPTGVLRIPTRFDKAGPFRHDRAWVCLGTRCGYIDKSGSTVWMPPETSRRRQ